MASIQLIIQDKELKKALKNLNKELEDKRLLHKELSIETFADVIDHFKKEEGPKQKWKRSVRAKEQGGKTLRDKGFLIGSISPFSSKKEAGVRTNVKYARIHQFGSKIKGGNVPKRAFFWASAKALNNMKKRVFEVLSKKWESGK